jgi:hypothetical protein
MTCYEQPPEKMLFINHIHTGGFQGLDLKASVEEEEQNVRIV